MSNQHLDPVTYDRFQAVMDNQRKYEFGKVPLEELLKLAAKKATEIATIEEMAGIRVPEKDVEKEPKKSGTGRRIKITPHILLAHFKETIHYVKIGGALHLFNNSLGYYTPVSKQELVAFMAFRYSAAEEYENSPTLVKRCADLVFQEYINEVIPADKNMLLCFQDGYLTLTHPNKFLFLLYNYPRFNPYPTYHILANGNPYVGRPDMAKTLATPNMDAFLNLAGNGAAKFAERVWEMIGYLITPDCNGKCLFLLQGFPNSGKSVLGNFIEALYPPSKLSSLDIDQLGKPHANSMLVNKCLNTSMDLPNKALSTSAIRTLKLITGNDDITVEYKNDTFERLQLTCKFLFATNHALTLRGVDSALEERIICIPFTNSISPAHRNPNLLNILLSERDNIVAKALAYYQDLRTRNYIFSGSEYGEFYKPHIRYLPNEAEDLDAGLCYFVESCCAFVSQENGIHAEDLYQEYRKFCRAYNETPVSNQQAFSRRLLRCYGDKIVKGKWRKAGENTPQWGFKGILLNPMSEIK